MPDPNPYPSPPENDDRKQNTKQEKTKQSPPKWGDKDKTDKTTSQRFSHINSHPKFHKNTLTQGTHAPLNTSYRSFLEAVDDPFRPHAFPLIEEHQELFDWIRVHAHLFDYTDSGAPRFNLSSLPSDSFLTTGKFCIIDGKLRHNNLGWQDLTVLPLASNDFAVWNHLIPQSRFIARYFYLF